MTNSNDPDQIRADIEATRRDLSRNVDALTDQVAPGNVARREANRVGDSLRGLKDRVMGSDDDYSGWDDGPRRGDQLRSQVGEARDQAAARLSDAQEAVTGAPGAARRRTRGNPLAAGLIAFGVGALIGGLMPSTQREREAGVALKERAEPLVEEAKGAAAEAVEHLKPHAQEAAESVKAHATDSAQAVKAEGQDAAAHVRGSAQESAQAVRSSAQDAKDDVQASRRDG